VLCAPIEPKLPAVVATTARVSVHGPRPSGPVERTARVAASLRVVTDGRIYPDVPGLTPLQPPDTLERCDIGGNARDHGFGLATPLPRYGGP
jgi:hypothetical protein